MVASNRIEIEGDHISIARNCDTPAVTTALINFDVNLEMAISRVLDGSIRPQNYLLGFNENGVGLAGFGKFDGQISAENKAKIRSLIQDIRAGKVADLPKVR